MTERVVDSLTVVVAYAFVCVGENNKEGEDVVFILLGGHPVLMKSYFLL